MLMSRVCCAECLLVWSTSFSWYPKVRCGSRNTLVIGNHVFICWNHGMINLPLLVSSDWLIALNHLRDGVLIWDWFLEVYGYNYFFLLLILYWCFVYMFIFSSMCIASYIDDLWGFADILFLRVFPCSVFFRVYIFPLILYLENE